MTTPSIQKLLDLFVYHPFQSNIDKTKEEALEIVDDILSKAVARITKEDTAGLFEQPVEYLQCFNQLCCDIAREGHNLTEADYQFLMDQYDLIQEPALKVHYTNLKQGLSSYVFDEDADDEEDQ